MTVCVHAGFCSECYPLSGKALRQSRHSLSHSVRRTVRDSNSGLNLYHPLSYPSYAESGSMVVGACAQPVASPDPPQTAVIAPADPVVSAGTTSPPPGRGYKLHFRPAEVFRGTPIYRQANNLAYAYETKHAAADADGA